MISAFKGRVLSPKTNIIYLWRPQDAFKNPRKSQFIFKYIIYVNIKILETQWFDCFRKRQGGNPDDPSNAILEILDME